MSSLKIDDLYRRTDRQSLIKDVSETSSKDIAIIGIGLRFPYAANLVEFWEIVQNGLDCVNELSYSRSEDANRYLNYIETDMEKVKYLHCSYLEDIDQFDYEMFKMTPKEASLTSPLQRIFLQTAWEAIEDAGYGGGKIANSNTGVFAGILGDIDGFKYKEMIENIDPSLLPLSTSGNLVSMIPGRVAYTFNLKGPAIVVDTACSSSLVSIDLACKSLRRGDCEMALAGGVKLSLLPVDRSYYKIGIESSDAGTHTFSDSADGSGLGEGAGVLLLKPLQQAIRDNDQIYAVIKGSATNQDGMSMGITAPNPTSQRDVLIKAWEDAEVDPETISLIEAHGTATILGDTVEMDGLTQAFSRYTAKKQFCAIGSVKSNIGHLYEAAGIAGIIKATAALTHKKLPPSISFDYPNRKIPFHASPVYVNTALRTWQTGRAPRRCGVSSFGISGTNSHVVLEEAPAAPAYSESPALILTLSAKDESSLHQLICRIREHIASNRERASDICYSANTGRTHHRIRLAAVAKDANELLSMLLELEQKGPFDRPSSMFYYRANSRHNSNEAQLRNSREQCERLRLKLKDASVSWESPLDMLRETAQAYVDMGDVEWELVYNAERRVRVNAPFANLSPQRCWLPIPESAPMHQADETVPAYYAWKWVSRPAVPQPYAAQNACILIMKDHQGYGEFLAEHYRRQGITVIEAVIGERFAQLAPTSFELSGEEDYVRMFSDIEAGRIDQIIHLSSLDTGPVNELTDLRASQRRGVHALYALIRAYIRCQPASDTDIVLVAANVYQAGDAPHRISPEHATLFGLGQVVGKEHPHLKCRCMDIDEMTSPSQLLEEIALKAGYYHTALRAGDCYIQQLCPVGAMPSQLNALPIRESGVYVITGGMGGIGLETASLIVAQANVHVILLSRTEYPAREERASWLARHPEHSLAEKMTRLIDMERNGSTIDCFAVDIADEERLSEVLERVRAVYGDIHGIIHAAGVGMSVDMMDKDDKQFRDVFDPKVYGTWLLHRLTEQDNLDFFYLYSSVATYFSAAGQSDYVAANAYLDCFSEYRSSQGKPSITINWSTWKEVGMAANIGFAVDTMFKAMRTSYAMQALSGVSELGLPRLLIGELNYDWPLISSLKSGIYQLDASIEIRLNERSGSRRVRESAVPSSASITKQAVIMMGKEQEDYSEAEVIIAGICRDVLQYQEIHIEDSFFELGADSFLLKQIQARLEQALPGKTTIADIFEHPSVAKLARFVERESVPISKKVTKSDEELEAQLHDLVDSIDSGTASLDEIISMLDKI
ncbi:phosphopantetheine binding protein [Paenibacillus cellulosilyticus]|uniref:Phosphopantetheine binding protein n=1 Tax=Paenibacillus cellulosilyticus TaxID=375489 RepID=A0A2V2Z1B4_9BACL|nr:SDR family NAD(P)-dependent oxidoreductase [Paenibacillus cellulosilyticus]PWW07331.1 phosphopantetheine binding protein [Paenibacillus cellulosilyticus]QKS44490.1 SDR family NAD(P)-dependent oxidoreductase [Paenibacillus cellulosilyticus]